MKDLTKPYIALSLTCFIWGTTYLVNKLGVGLIPAFLFTSVRHAVSGVLLLSFVFLFHKEKWPDGKFIRLQVLLGFFLLTIGNGVGVIGLKYIDSGLSAILAATSPILVSLLVHHYTPHDKIGTKAWIGILFGFLGLVIICVDKIKFPLHLDANFIGIGLTLISVITWGAASVYSKMKVHNNSPFMAAGFQMLFASIPLGFISIFYEDHSQFHLTNEMIGVWAYVIILGSLVAYTAYIYALKYLPAPIVSIQSYINPIIAMNLGYFILGEKMNAQLIFGATLTLFGVFIVNYSEQRRKKKLLI